MSDNDHSPQVKALIDAFLSIWPMAEWGPAHVALSDYNLGDGDLAWCLELAQAVLGGYTTPATEEVMQGCDYLGRLEHTRDEIEATAHLLEILMLIPSDEREGWPNV